MKRIGTLCFIQDNDNILLAMKKRGHGVGRWNGYGGKLNEGETIEEALVRELEEESGVIAKEFEKRAIITFFEEYEEGCDFEVHVFAITNYEGDPVETEEMAPKWFDLKNVPFEDMWPSDRNWMPIYLEGHKFIGKVIASPERKEEFTLVDNLEGMENAKL